MQHQQPAADRYARHPLLNLSPQLERVWIVLESNPRSRHASKCSSVCLCRNSFQLRKKKRNTSTAKDTDSWKKRISTLKRDQFTESVPDGGSGDSHTSAAGAGRGASAGASSGSLRGNSCRALLSGSFRSRIVTRRERAKERE